MSAASREEPAPRVRLHPEGGPFWLVRGGFDTPVRLLATKAAAEALRDGGELESLRPITRLPGIVPAVIALPAFARAHGVPLATVIVTDPGLEGVVIPAAVGHGIGNGMRAVALPWDAAAIQAKRDAIAAALRAAMAGLPEPLGDDALDAACAEGVRWAVRKGWGDADDAKACEDRGAVNGADPAVLSTIARARGCAQFGSLGNGAHAAIVSTAPAHRPESLGLEPGQAVLIIAAGSRGLGYQVTEDAIDQMARAGIQHRIPITQRALACVPAHAREGRDYLAAMAAARNFAAAHRQCLAARALPALESVLGRAPASPRLLADHCHQCVQVRILRDGVSPRRVLIHRKGCIALEDDPCRLRLLSAGPGHDAWLVTTGPGAHATHFSACHITAPGALQAQRDAEIITIEARLTGIVAV